MKTLAHPSDLSLALTAIARDWALDNPVAAFALCVALTAAFATWATRN